MLSGSCADEQRSAPFVNDHFVRGRIQFRKLSDHRRAFRRVGVGKLIAFCDQPPRQDAGCTAHTDDDRATAAVVFEILAPEHIVEHFLKRRFGKRQRHPRFTRNRAVDDDIDVGMRAKEPEDLRHREVDHVDRDLSQRYRRLASSGRPSGPEAGTDVLFLKRQFQTVFQVLYVDQFKRRAGKHLHKRITS